MDLSLPPLAFGAGHRQARKLSYRHSLASAGFRLFWTWKVRRGLPGRPVISREVRDLIRKMCRVNPRRGAPRIHGDLHFSMPSYLKRPIVAEVEAVIKSLARQGVDVLESDSPETPPRRAVVNLFFGSRPAT